MKKDIHPEYKETTITCACGNVIHTRSTKSNIRIEICSSCHPFFTGKQKLVDTAGRVERFRRRYGLEEFGTEESLEEKVEKSPDRKAMKAADQKTEESPDQKQSDKQVEEKQSDTKGNEQ